METIDPHRLIADHQASVYNYVRRMIQSESDAADVTQEVFTAVLSCLDRYDAGQPIRPWIYGIASRTVARHFRDRRARNEKERQAAMRRPEIDHDRQAEERDERRVVQQYLGELPVGVRELLVLRYFNGLTP